MSVAEGHNVEVLCWFINDDLEKIFSVEIKSTQTVAALRSKIKEDNPRRLAQVDARSLTLWKVRPRSPVFLEILHQCGSLKI